MEGGGATWVIVTKEKTRVKSIKKAAEANGIYDKTRLITYLPEDDVYAIPVSSNSTQLLNHQPTELTTQYDVISPAPFQGCQLIRDSVSCGRSKVKRKTDTVFEMRSIINQLSTESGHSKSETEQLLKSLPTAWVQHGDMIVLPGARFHCPLWEGLIASTGRGLWERLAKVLNCNRIALHEKIADDKFRTPVNRLVLGQDGWVSHIDNGVCYVFDVTRTMFSQGNITEKIRMGNIGCKDEVIVDLFAGIGYFTLPVLVHGRAQCVYACEWNPWAVEGLRRGLTRNRVSDRCIVLHGDNRKVAPRGIADRVILGLIPSSEDSWETGCACIKPDKGGWLHVHGNVTTCLKEERGEGNGYSTIDENRETVDDSIQDDQAIVNRSCSDLLKQSSQEWSEYTKSKIAGMFNRLYNDSSSGTGNATSWSVCVRHIEHVKSYAPHVHHVVVDLECRPCSI